MNTQLILERIEKEIEYPIFEVSRSRPQELKDIERLFDQIRRLKFGSRERIILVKDLAKSISIFTKIKKVVVSTKKNYFNATVMADYNNLLPELFKKKIKPEEANRYIKGFYLVIGDQMYNKLQAKELTAILLHEIGHLYQHTALLGLAAPKIVKSLSLTASWLSTFTTLASGGTTAPITIPLSMATYALSRTLTFGEHMNELDADDYAAKHGYGDEIAKAFYKFNKIKTGGSIERQPKSWLGRIYKFIKKSFDVSTHPSDPDRICSVINSMKKDYVKQYPKLSKEISTIYADIRC